MAMNWISANGENAIAYYKKLNAQAIEPAIDMLEMGSKETKTLLSVIRKYWTGYAEVKFEDLLEKELKVEQKALKKARVNIESAIAQSLDDMYEQDKDMMDTVRG